MRQLTLSLCLALAVALVQANAESPTDAWTWAAKSEESSVGSSSKAPAGAADQPAAEITPRKSGGFSFPGPQSGDSKDVAPVVGKKAHQPAPYQASAAEDVQAKVANLKGDPTNDIADPKGQINPRHGKSISAKAVGDPAVNIEARFGKKLCKWSGFCKGKHVHPSEVIYVQPVKIQAVGDEIPAIIGTKKGGGLSLTHGSSSSGGYYGPPAPYFPPVPIQHHHDHHHHHKHKGPKLTHGWGGLSSSSSGVGFVPGPPLGGVPYARDDTAYYESPEVSAGGARVQGGGVAVPPGAGYAQQNYGSSYNSGAGAGAGFSKRGPRQQNYPGGKKRQHSGQRYQGTPINPQAFQVQAQVAQAQLQQLQQYGQQQTIYSQPSAYNQQPAYNQLPSYPSAGPLQNLAPNFQGVPLNYAQQPQPVYNPAAYSPAQPQQPYLSQPPRRQGYLPAAGKSDDCVCVPASSCAPQDILGRENRPNFQYNQLDPRNKFQSAEASDGFADLAEALSDDVASYYGENEARRSTKEGISASTEEVKAVDSKDQAKSSDRRKRQVSDIEVAEIAPAGSEPQLFRSKRSPQRTSSVELPSSSRKLKGGKGDEHDIVPSFGVSLFTRPYNTHADGRPLAILPQLALNVDVEDGETVFRPRLEFNVLPGFLPGHSNDFGLSELLDGRYGSHHSAAYNHVPHAAGPYYNQKPHFPGYPVYGTYPLRPYGYPYSPFLHHGHFDDDFEDEFEEYPGVEYIPGEHLPELQHVPEVIHVESNKGPQLHHHIHFLNGNPLAGGSYAGQFQHQAPLPVSQEIATQVQGTAIGLAPLPLGGSAEDIQKKLQVIQQLQELNKLQQLQLSLQQSSQQAQAQKPQQQYSPSFAQQAIPINIPITAQLGEGGGVQGISIGRNVEGRSAHGTASKKTGRVIFPNEHEKLAQARQAGSIPKHQGKRRSFAARGNYGDTEKLSSFRRDKRSAQRYSDAVVIEDHAERPPAKPSQPPNNPAAPETLPAVQGGAIPPAAPANPSNQNRPNRPWGPIGAIQGAISSLFPTRPPPQAPENDEVPGNLPAEQQPNRPFGFITEAIQTFVPGLNPNPGVATEGGGGGFGQGGGLGFGKGKGNGPVFNYKPLIIGQTVNHGGSGLGGPGSKGGAGLGNNKGNKGSLKDKFEEKRRKKKNKKKPMEDEEDEYHEPTQYSNFIRPGIGVNLLLKPKYVPLDSHQGVDLLPQVGLGVEYGKGRFKYQPRAHLNVFPAGFFGPYPAHVSKPPPPPPIPAPQPNLPPAPNYVGGAENLLHPDNYHQHVHNYVPGVGLSSQAGPHFPLSLESQELKQGTDANLPSSGSLNFGTPESLDNLNQQLAILQKLQELKLAEIQSSSSQLSPSDLTSLQNAGLLPPSSFTQPISLTPPVQSSALNPSPLIEQYLKEQSQLRTIPTSSPSSQDLSALIRALQSLQTGKAQHTSQLSVSNPATLNSFFTSPAQANRQPSSNAQRNAFTTPRPSYAAGEKINGLPAFYFQSYYNGGDAGARRTYAIRTHRLSRFKRQSKSQSRVDSASGASINTLDQHALSQALGVPVSSIPSGLSSNQLQQLQLLNQLQKLQTSSPGRAPVYSSAQQKFERPSNPLVSYSPGVLNPSGLSQISSQTSSTGLSTQNQPGYAQVIPIEQSTNSGTFVGVIKGVFIPKYRSPRLVEPIAQNQVSSQATFSNHVQSHAQSVPVLRPESVTVINPTHQQQLQSSLYPSKPSIEVGPELCRYVACAQLESQCGISQYARVTNSARETETKTERQLGGSSGVCSAYEVCCRNPLSGGRNPVNSGQCGVRYARGITGRVKTLKYVDGDAEFGEYPWQAAVLKKEGIDNVYVCGGSLIDAQHILTAAHCIKGYAPGDLRVRLGEWDVNHDTEFYTHVEKDVVAVVIHPEFYAGSLYNDIAVLRLDSYVDFSRNPHVSPVCLPSQYSELPAGYRCWTTGWGKDAWGNTGQYQNILKEVDVPLVQHHDCQNRLQSTRLGVSFALHEGFLCAGGEHGKDACKGDGGGPLVCDIQGTWQLAGIVSWGIGCGQQDVPGVYVKVSNYLPWIQSVTRSTLG